MVFYLYYIYNRLKFLLTTRSYSATATWLVSWQRLLRCQSRRRGRGRLLIRANLSEATTSLLSQHLRRHHQPFPETTALPRSNRHSPNQHGNLSKGTLQYQPRTLAISMSSEAERTVMPRKHQRKQPHRTKRIQASRAYSPDIKKRTQSRS